MTPSHPAGRLRRLWAAVAMFGCGLAFGSKPGQAQPLTRVLDIRQLSSEEAAKGHPVRLKGTVLALSGWKNSFFLEDTDGGISVDRADSAEVHAGDEVEITGVSGAGLFAPVVLAYHVEVRGPGRHRKAK